MILPDVNVLVYAFHRGDPLHTRYEGWIDRAIERRQGPIALAEGAVAGFIRVVTNPKIFNEPAAATDASDSVDALLDGGARWIGPTPATWSTFRRIVDLDPGIRANLVPDAWLAALAISHGCRLATADRGFGRFPGLDWFDPAST